jgi:WD40 repeat protein
MFLGGKQSKNVTVRLLSSRGSSSSSESRFMHSLNVLPTMVPRMALLHTLSGHQGCVNRIKWHPKGLMLASGSDDTKIGIWQYPSGRRLEFFDTGHSANIFGVRFLTETDIVSCAMDCEVRLHELQSTPHATTVYECHTNRVKDVEVEPGVGGGNIWWSASEDGTVRQV